ncbi:MAG: ROK family transcriptional regulator, partial [Myxococcota bacterium]
MLGTNQEYAKSYNLRIVLEAIRTNGPLSRADVARATRLTRQTISNIVDELLSQQLVSETGRQQGRRGTPATLLEFQPKAAYSIGFDLDQAHLTAVLMDLNGAVEVRYQERLNYPSPQESLEKMTHLTKQLLEQQNLPRSKICGVGIGVPGPMRMLDSAKDQRQVINPHGFPGWENTPIAEHLAERLDLPVQLENNATAAAPPTNATTPAAPTTVSP